jgi:hypothetical protein
MKFLLRSCQLHDEKYIAHVLGRFFAYRGRKYRPYRRTVADPFANTIIKYHVSGLNRWISRATENLCADARERIRAEITGHCQDALIALMGSGRPQGQARVWVLEGLGDPVQANAAFQKTYLTSWQERFMARMSEVQPTHFQVLCTAILFVCIPTLFGPILALARAWGWIDRVEYFATCSTLAFCLPTQIVCGLFAVHLGRFRSVAAGSNPKTATPWERLARRTVQRITPWALFALLLCLYVFWKLGLTFEESLLSCMTPSIPFL